MSGPLVTFLSDYGHHDEFVGVCHGVIARRCPNARVIDISHAIAPQDVREGALVLADALPFMPAGVHLAVVDPSVGAQGVAARRAVALRTAAEDRLLVGPDNGLLTLAAERFAGVAECVEIGQSPARLQPLSYTFHGRDLFAPVAAALAAGEPLYELGEPLAGHELHPLALAQAQVRDGVLCAHALRCDHFGNVILDAGPEQLDEIGAGPGQTLALRIGERNFTARHVATFAEVPAGKLLLYTDSTDRVAIAVNCASAAELLDLARDAELRLSVAT